MTRRELLAITGATSLGAFSSLRLGAAPSPAAKTVSIAKAPSYGDDLVPTLNTMFDQLVA